MAVVFEVFVHLEGHRNIEPQDGVLDIQVLLDIEISFVKVTKLLAKARFF